MKYSEKIMELSDTLLETSFQFANLTQDYSTFRATLVNVQNDVLKQSNQLLNLAYKIEDTEDDWDLTEE